MKKNSFFTFLFALIPGAGHMYQSYMKRGLSLMLLFCADIALTTIIGLAGIFLPVIWAYSFFDTYRLRSELEAGVAPPDTSLFGSGKQDSVLTAFLSRRHALVGWGLVLLGSWFIFDNILLESLRDIFSRYELWAFYDLIYRAPTLLVSLLLIVLGIMLVRGKGLARPKEASYPEYLASGVEDDEPDEEESDDDDE